MLILLLTGVNNKAILNHPTIKEYTLRKPIQVRDEEVRRVIKGVAKARNISAGEVVEEMTREKYKELFK
jgi:hypothetical protein